jgi:hypothetical protein
MLQLFFISFDFFILHQHQSDGEVEDEKGTNPDHGDEVKVDECCHVNILVDVHDLGPAIEGGANENGQECIAYVVKVYESIHQVVMV